jgi:hypothetical protein
LLIEPRNAILPNGAIIAHVVLANNRQSLVDQIGINVVERGLKKE